MKIPQMFPFIGMEEYDSMRECFETNWVTEGPKAKQFVDNLCEIIGVKYGVLAPNGTLALYLGLKALGIGFGDEVIVPNFTFIASANAVLMANATPVFVDIEPEGLQLGGVKKVSV
jgi:perosamine synthetase